MFSTLSWSTISFFSITLAEARLSSYSSYASIYDFKYFSLGSVSLIKTIAPINLLFILLNLKLEIYQAKITLLTSPP